MPELSPQDLRLEFGLTDELLERRQKVAGYIHSFAALIADSFFDDHLVHDVRCLPHLAHDDRPRHKRALREQLIALFTDPLDAAFVDRFQGLGNAREVRNLRPIQVVRGFDVLQQVICQLAGVNRAVQDDLGLILKMLRIAEFLTLAAHQQASAPDAGRSCREHTLMDAFDRLFHIHAVHRDSLQRVRELWQAERPGPVLVAAVKAYDGDSPVSTLLAGIGDVDKLGDALQLDVAQAQLDNMVYRQSYRALVGRLEDGASREALLPLFNELQRQSDAFLSTVGKPMQDLTATSFLAVNSGFRFVQLMATNLFDERTRHYEHRELVELIEAELPALLNTAMGWCIANLTITRGELATTDCDLVEVIPLKHARLTVGVKLRDLPNRLFLQELLQMMLELTRTDLLNKEREATLLELADTAERANRSKDMFLANMSHELRTPLNAIIGFAQILERHKDLPANLKAYIGKIGVAGNNLLLLVNTILDFAKLEAGKIAFEPKDTAFAPLLQEAILITEPLARAKRITFEYPDAVADSVEMDPQLIKQVLLNLLSNAVKFTPEGGRIWLALDRSDQRAAFQVSVGDTGVGIPLEDQRDLFSPFKQLDNPMRRSVGGTGLGLSIAKKIIENLHGGVLEVDSEPGQGSVFSFTLPLRRVETFLRRHACADPEAPHLLIAEDAEEMVAVLVEALRDRFHLTVTNSVERAKSVLQRDHFAFLVLDFFLVDGVSTEIVRHMEDRGVATPVIIISAEDDGRLLANLGPSELIEGVFGKQDIDQVCRVLRQAHEGSPA